MTSRVAAIAAAALALVALGSVAPDRASAACTKFVPLELEFGNGGLERTRRANRSSVVTGRVYCEDGRPATDGAVGMGENIFIASTGQFIPFNLQSVSLTPQVQGRFVFEVPPGPSRVLTVAYFPPGGGANFAPYQLLLNMSARPKLKASKNHRRVGQKTEFFGSIPDYFINGRPAIALQAKSGRKWRTFKVVTPNETGKFSGVYRFSRTSRPTVYRFRAKIVKGGTDYPYVTRTSQKSRVYVRP